MFPRFWVTYCTLGNFLDPQQFRQFSGNPKVGHVLIWNPVPQWALQGGKNVSQTPDRN